MTKILLADDHAIIRAGLKIYIENIIPDSNTDEAYDGDSAFKKMKENDYALIILDINMPATDSFTLVSNMLTVKPNSKILMFSMNSEEIYAKKYISLGALGYINKDACADEIMTASNNVMRGKRYISPSLIQILAVSALDKKSHKQNPFELLSSRELEIARHIMKGDSVSEIAKHLNLHTSTIGTHKARIFDKLKCKNIIDMNELARVHKFVQSD